MRHKRKCGALPMLRKTSTRVIAPFGARRYRTAAGRPTGPIRSICGYGRVSLSCCTRTASGRWLARSCGLHDGVAGVRRVEAFFAARAALTERARALIVATAAVSIAPREPLRARRGRRLVAGSIAPRRAPACLRRRTTMGRFKPWPSLHEPAAT